MNVPENSLYYLINTIPEYIVPVIEPYYIETCVFCKRDTSVLPLAQSLYEVMNYT